MPERWTPDALLAAVRAGVPSVSSDGGDVPVLVELDGEDLLVTFRCPGEPPLFGLRFATAEAPEGPSTGDVCETPEEWAQEVGWVLMEALDTGVVRWGRRTRTPAGVVELDPRGGDAREP